MQTAPSYWWPRATSRIAAEDGRGVEICVRDHGIGIDPESVEQVFLPFKRLHGRGEFAGSGEIVVVRRSADGALTVVGRIAPRSTE